MQYDPERELISSPFELFVHHVTWQHWIEKLVNLQASLQTGIIIIIICSYSYVMRFWSQIVAFLFLAVYKSVNFCHDGSFP